MNIIKRMGGKTRELKLIKPLLPKFKHYYEPFVGGGAVYLAVKAEQYFLNDKSRLLMDLYNSIKNQDTNFFHTLDIFQDDWERLRENVSKFKSQIFEMLEHAKQTGEIKTSFLLEPCWKSFKLVKIMKNVDWASYLEKAVQHKVNRIFYLENKAIVFSQDDYIANIESAVKSAYYNVLKSIFNDLHADNTLRTASFLTVSSLSFSGQNRYNKAGQFNSPYGGRSYNQCKLNNKTNLYQSESFKEKMRLTTLSCQDFTDFFDTYSPSADDFVFVDPPYDGTYSKYDQNAFTVEDHKRLADYLINKCRGKFLLVVEDTALMRELYPVGVKCANGENLNLQQEDFSYNMSMCRLNKPVVNHLFIGNYTLL